MERCPNCRARLGDTATCRRCGMELDRLLEVEKAAERLTAQSVAHLAVGDPEAATDDLTQVLGLHRNPFAEALFGFAKKLAEDR
jgi:predicted amidophosphoribosyltransferase